ncbi:hypothetical protein C8R45DRAFT_1209264 [Mycena sanguinolenta]|nr:hypothetical protein C8R45DRAFT_1209264 [Mycena sanguinolenta]
MDTLPPELIQAIVAEIGDTGSLKTCSLVARIFLESCQRILFRSLVIAKDGDYHIESLVLWSRLQQAPHLGKYFESLTCALPSADAPHAEVDALCAVLDHLANIRRCVLVRPDAGPPELCLWHNLPSQLSPAILKFIQRPQLSQLHLFSIASLQGNVLAMCLAVRSLALIDTSVDNIAIAADILASYSGGVEELAILSSPDIVDILTSPQCSRHVAKIRNLWIADRAGMKLLSTVAANLQHLGLDSDEGEANLGDFLHLPQQLPCLRSIEITLDFRRRYDAAFVPILASVVGAASATLQEIYVIYASVHDSQVKRSLAPQTMAAVEEVIAGCTGFTRIRWQTEHPVSETIFHAFSASLTEGMPRLHTEGRLFVEKCASHNDGPCSGVKWFER